MEAGHAGRPRLDHVAAEVGVSPATVSLVLRGVAGPSAATRERVLEAAARLGYRPDRAASALASRRSRLIGVLLEIGNPFHGQLVLDVHVAAQRHGYDLVLSTVGRSNDEDRAINTLLDSRCEALILLGPTGPTQSLGRVGMQLPVVVVGRPVQSTALDVVRTADEQGIAEAVAHLNGLGHHRIAYVDGGRGTVPALRRKGYEQAMRAYELAGHIQVIKGGDSERSGNHAAQSVLRSLDRPTAVLTFNDACAIGLIDALNRGGQAVPQDISVIGYDDSPIARLPQINLTTVAQDTQALADYAVAAVVERLDDHRESRREEVVPPHFIKRGTTAPPTVVRECCR